MDSAIFSLWPIAPFGGEDGDEGGASNGDGAQGNSDNNANGDGSQGNSAPGDDGDGSDSGDGGDEDEFAGYSAKELRRIAAENKKKADQAEKDRKAAQAKIDAEERKKNDDLTNAKKDIEDLRTENTTLRATLNKLAIQGAIRDDSRFEWHDVEMVAGLLDPTVVKVNDDGKVEGIKASLPKIAKEHPFLLKKENGKNNNGSQQNNNGGPTGFQPGQGGASGGGSETDKNQLVENYPALATRV